MKIDELKINSYGKLKNKDINFNKKINIVYGENEKGKSTLLNYIVNSFYGTSKNKKGRDISDFEKYKPWDTEEFSGQLIYTLDNGKKYEIHREFGKKNPKLYNDNYDEISKDYTIDKSSGSQFFLEQTNVDEDTFVSSVVAFQNEVELTEQTQNNLLQRIANSSSTGSDNISYKRAMDKLNKKQTEEVGTNRTQGKPINIVLNEIESIKQKNEELKRYVNYKYEIEDKKNLLQNEINNLNSKYDFYSKYNKIKQEESMSKEKISIQEQRIDDIEQKIQNLLDQKNNLKDGKVEINNNEEKSVNIVPYILVSIALIIFSVIIYLMLKNIIFSVIPILLVIICILLYFSKSKTVKRRNRYNSINNAKIANNNMDIDRKNYEISAQIDILEKSKEKEAESIEFLKNEVYAKSKKELEQLKSLYHGIINESEINNMETSLNLQNQIDYMQKTINDKNVDLYRINLDKENIMPKVEELAENEEKLAEYNELYNEIIEKNDAINLAKEVLENSYQKMKSSVTPGFTENLSNNISKITSGKYKRIIINEDDGILVELENGEYKEASRLSFGTIQQIYLAFRLATVESVSEESMPIILDEAFAYFDDSRLKETLINLNNYYANNHQIIILTCTNREESTLNELGYEYNKVSL